MMLPPVSWISVCISQYICSIVSSIWPTWQMFAYRFAIRMSEQGFRDSALSDATRMNGEAVSYATRHAVP